MALGDSLISGPKGYAALGAFNSGERSTALDLLKEKGLISSGQPVVIQGDSLQGELLADSIIFMRVE